jgi:hypothetical protein
LGPAAAARCSLTVTYESKWLVTQCLPLLLALCVGIVLVVTRAVQLVQQRVFHVLPFGALTDVNLQDVCVGVMITGAYYLYFRTWPRTARGGNGAKSVCTHCVCFVCVCVWGGGGLLAVLRAAMLPVGAGPPVCAA